MSIQTVAIRTLSFILPPLLVGGLSATQTVQDLMRHRQPKLVLTAGKGSAEAPFPAPAALDPAKPVVLFVLSDQATEVFDLLSSYEILGRTGKYNLVTASPERKAVATTGAVAVLSDYAFRDAPAADILVLPAVVDPQDERLVAFVKERAPKVKRILSLCEGTRLAAAAGLIDGKQVVTHFMARDELARAHPTANFPAGLRWTRDGNLISSVGITGSIDGTLALVAEEQGIETARALGETLGWKWIEGAWEAPRIEGGERPRLLLNAAFDWSRRYFTVLLAPGVSELSLGSWLDAIPRTLSSRTTTLAAQRTFIVSRHGMTLVPSEGLAEAVPGHRMVIPSYPGAAEGFDPDRALTQWAADFQMPLEDFRFKAPAASLDRVFASLQEEGAGSTAVLAARMMEYPGKVPGPQGMKDPKVLWLLARALALGFLGMWFVKKVLRWASAPRSA